ncbi:MAG: hypothetical protein ACRENQ_01340, partial [Gemmatimonadaceae bacterium]
GQVAERWYHTPNPSIVYTGQRTYRGSKRTVQVTPLTIAGRRVVLYVDVPTGSSTKLLDAAAIKLK